MFIHIILAFSLVGYETSDALRGLRHDDLVEMTAFARTIPDKIKNFFKEKKITPDTKQITLIQHLFLGSCSNDPYKFRSGDVALILEVAEFVRSEDSGIGCAIKRSTTAKTPVGELFTPDGMTFETNAAVNEETNRNNGNCAEYLFNTFRFTYWFRIFELSILFSSKSIHLTKN